MTEINEKEILHRLEIISQIKPTEQAANRVMERVRVALLQEKEEKPNVKFWRIIMKKPITKLAAAAVIIIAAVFGITLLDRSATPAYAIEQTIEANRNLGQIHFRYYDSNENQMKKECWVKFDLNGQPKNVRVNFYNWGNEDIVMIWKEGKTQYWLKRNNRLEFFEDKSYTAKVLKLVHECNPRTAVEVLYEHQKKVDVNIEIEQPSDKSQPIVIKGTFKPGTYLLDNPALPAFRDVLFIDQTTKLVTTIEIYELEENGKSIPRGMWKYEDYSEPFDEEIFDIEKEVPLDVKLVDLMTLDIGMKQGELSDKEIAVKVVREFLEALIAKDYAKAGKLYGGMSDQEAQEKLTVKIIRIISIGDPVQQVRPADSFRVPCILEIEENGKAKEWKPGPIVKPVSYHSDSWAICGGF